jgi:hypothetical protein
MQAIQLFRSTLMCLLAIGIFCFCTPVTVSAQPGDPATVKIFTYWNKNETFRYEFIKGTVRFNDDGTVKDSTANTEVKTLTVIDSTKDNYTIRISYETCDVSSLKSMGFTDGELSSLLEKYKDLKLNYKIDSIGAFLNVIDERQFVKMTQDMMSTMLKSKVKDKAEREKVQKLIEPLVTSEYIVDKAFEDIKLLHEFLGGEFYLDSLVNFELPLSNPLNPKDSLMRVCALLLHYPEDMDGVLEAELESDIFTDGQTLMSNFSDFPNVKSDELKNMKMKIHNYTDYMIDADKGVVVYYWFVKEVYINDKLSRKDFIEASLLED